jgi:hypothetical protein
MISGLESGKISAGLSSGPCDYTMRVMRMPPKSNGSCVSLGSALTAKGVCTTGRRDPGKEDGRSKAIDSPDLRPKHDT